MTDVYISNQYTWIMNIQYTLFKWNGVFKRNGVCPKNHHLEQMSPYRSGIVLKWPFGSWYIVPLTAKSFSKSIPLIKDILYMYIWTADQLLSSSYKAPGLTGNQPWRRTEVGQLSATFTQGARFPENMTQQTAVRPIKMHMRATNSDGSKIISPDQQHNDIGTPRRQHGFQVQ